MTDLTPEQRAFYKKQIAEIRHELANAEFVMNNPREVDGLVNDSVEYYLGCVTRRAKEVQLVASGESNRHLRQAPKKNKKAP